MNRAPHIPRTSLSRRQFLKLSALTGGFGALGLSACSERLSVRQQLGSGSTNLRILNWTQYIDTGGSGTVNRFQQFENVYTQYSEEFDDNDRVYADVLQPALSKGEPVDWDVVCPTFWMAARLIAQGWVEPLPLDLIPNHANIDEAFLGVPFDRGGLYNMPWQSGITGIAFNAKETSPVSTVKDLLSRPDLKGRVAFFSEIRDSLGLTLLSMGRDPSSTTAADAMDALELLRKAVRDGQVVAFATNQEYLDGLKSGRFLASVAWSGDLVQLKADRPEFEFVLADEGGMQFFDTMVIPKGSANGVAAATWMNFVYDPTNAAQITAATKFISPVIGVREELVKLGQTEAALAESPLLFPDAAMRRRLFTWNGTSPAEDKQIADLFAKLKDELPNAV
jgi:spermidine/putrescine transport system substrate-binding protein